MSKVLGVRKLHLTVLMLHDKALSSTSTLFPLGFLGTSKILGLICPIRRCQKSELSVTVVTVLHVKDVVYSALLCSVVVAAGMVLCTFWPSSVLKE